MGEQQSQKRGTHSDAQKTDRARQGYETIPPAQPVAGAFGDHESEAATDQDVALRLNEKRATKTPNADSRDE